MELFHYKHDNYQYITVKIHSLNEYTVSLILYLFSYGQDPQSERLPHADGKQHVPHAIRSGHCKHTQVFLTDSTQVRFI